MDLTIEELNLITDWDKRAGELLSKKISMNPVELFNERISLKIKEASELFHLNKSITTTYGSELLVKYTTV